MMSTQISIMTPEERSKVHKQTFQQLRVKSLITYTTRSKGSVNLHQGFVGLFLVYKDFYGKQGIKTEIFAKNTYKFTKPAKNKFSATLPLSLDTIPSQSIGLNYFMNSNKRLWLPRVNSMTYHSNSIEKLDIKVNTNLFF